MTKCFVLSESSSEETLKFIHSLIYYSNNQRVVDNRFRQLIQSNSQEESDTGTTDSRDDLVDEEQKQRRSYLLPSDLFEDLIECQCDGYMNVKSGFANISESFTINT
jgi:hypothetical protein